MTDLNLHDTRHYLAAYGVDVSRWPDPVLGAKALKDHSAALAGEISEAETLDHILEPVLTAHSAPPSELLPAHIRKSLTQTSDASPHGTAVVKNMTPRNDNGNSTGRYRSFSKHWGSRAAAAIFVAAIGYSALTLQSPLTDNSGEWQEAAADLGVSDVYSWVMDTPADADF